MRSASRLWMVGLRIECRAVLIAHSQFSGITTIQFALEWAIGYTKSAYGKGYGKAPGQPELSPDLHGF